MIVEWLFIAAAVFGALVAALRFTWWRSDSLRTMMALREEFFDAAHALGNSDHVPEIVLDHLGNIAGLLDGPMVGRNFLSAALRGELRASLENPPRDFQDFRAAVRSMSDESQRQFRVASATAMLAATHKNIVIGSFLRRAILFPVRVSQELAELIAFRVGSSSVAELPSAAT